MSPEALSALAGALLSVLMNYVPGLSAALDRLTADAQRLVMAALLAVAAVGMAIWTCTDPTAGGLKICLGETFRRPTSGSSMPPVWLDSGSPFADPSALAEDDAIVLREMGIKPP